MAGASPTPDIRPSTDFTSAGLPLTLTDSLLLSSGFFLVAGRFGLPKSVGAGIVALLIHYTPNWHLTPRGTPGILSLPDNQGIVWIYNAMPGEVLPFRAEQLKSQEGFSPHNAATRWQARGRTQSQESGVPGQVTSLIGSAGRSQSQVAFGPHNAANQWQAWWKTQSQNLVWPGPVGSSDARRVKSQEGWKHPSTSF